MEFIICIPCVTNMIMYNRYCNARVQLLMHCTSALLLSLHGSINCMVRIHGMYILLLLLIFDNAHSNISFPHHSKIVPHIGICFDLHYRCVYIYSAVNIIITDNAFLVQYPVIRSTFQYWHTTAGAIYLAAGQVQKRHWLVSLQQQVVTDRHHIRNFLRW